MESLVADVLRRFPTLVFAFLSSLLVWCMVGPSAFNSMEAARVDGRAATDSWATTPPIDTLLAVADWADWTWLMAYLVSIETWIGDPDRAAWLSAAGVLMVLVGFGVYLATDRDMLVALSFSWLGVLLQAQLGYPAWQWLMALTLCLSLLALAAKIVLYVAEDSDRNRMRYRYHVRGWPHRLLRWGRDYARFWALGVIGVAGPVIALVEHHNERA